MCMNTVDSSKIIYPVPAKTAFRLAILYYCLKSTLGILRDHLGHNPSLCFRLLIDLSKSKQVKCTVHHIRFDKKSSEKIYLIPITGAAA